MLSRAMISSHPASTSRSTICDPTNPAPPVTSTRWFISPLKPCVVCDGVGVTGCPAAAPSQSRSVRLVREAPSLASFRPRRSTLSGGIGFDIGFLRTAAKGIADGPDSRLSQLGVDRQRHRLTCEPFGDWKIADRVAEIRIGDLQMNGARIVHARSDALGCEF